MKTVSQFAKMNANQRSKTLQTLSIGLNAAKKEIVKVLVAAEESGDFGKGEMNAYAQRITGIELRREAQGTYEAVNVMKGIRAGVISMTEEEFDSKKFGSFPLIMLSGFMAKSPEKVLPALEIIRSGDDVTRRLKELRTPDKEKEGKESPEKGAVVVTEIQASELPEGDSFFVPTGQSILNVPEIQARILEDLRNAADVESCENYHEFFKGLVDHLHSRWEVLETAKALKGKKVAA